MTNFTEKEIRERFDEKFPGHNINSVKELLVAIEDIKQYQNEIPNHILSELSLYKQSLKEKVEGKKKPPQKVQKFTWPDAFGNTYPDVIEEEMNEKDKNYNQAIEEVLDLLT